MTEQVADKWLKLAQDAFRSSTDYLDANWRKQWERNISLFQSRHPDGSKYNSAAFKHRSRLFRPKTKSVVRKNEAAAAAAFFANPDVVNIEAENDNDPAQLASAALMNEVINYRLTKTIPWYMLLIGALQEAQVIGIVASYQYWKYRERTETDYEPLTDDIGQPLTDADGNPLAHQVERVEVIEDKPCLELIPVENIRFDPGADWTDVVGSSPYLIRMVPMYVDQVRQMMAQADPKTGRPKWKKYEDAEIRQAMVDYDTIRGQREAKKQDPKAENDTSLTDFEIVWCHENFVRVDGDDMVYWTLGTQQRLTEPKEVHEVYHHLAEGERPVVIGSFVIEAHRPVPDSVVGIGAELQKEVNDTVNQRRDNVALVLNKRYYVKRNAQADVESLMRNVPGGVTMVNDPQADIVEANWPDVTGSAYQEQDRLNVDFDELTGNFSQSSVSTSRNLNETVGGMKMLGSSASQMTEYGIRTFVETWVEPVLAQLVRLEQAYETDTVVLGLAGQRAQMQKYGVDRVTDELLNQSLTVRVNVGMGATNPQEKLGRFMFALKTYGEAMQMIPDADPQAVRDEIFGLAGYKGGQRFFKQQDDPKSAALMQQMQQMQQALQEMQQKLAVQDVQLKNKAGELQVKGFDAETKRIAALKPEAQQAPEAPDVAGIIDAHTRAADAETKRMQVVADAQNKQAQTLADAHLKAAQIDLLQAQAAKTDVDAKLAPSVALAKKATDAE